MGRQCASTGARPDVCDTPNVSKESAAGQILPEKNRSNLICAGHS